MASCKLCYIRGCALTFCFERFVFVIQEKKKFEKRRL